MKNIFRPNYLRLGITLIALLITSIITLTLYLRFTPWSMEQIKTTYLSHRSPSEFRDLNHDGFSEFFEIANDNKGDINVHYIVFYNYDLGTIDQCNTREYINPQNVFYGDYTGDGYDECFIFTAKEDSVFLYVFNVIGQNVLINRQFVISLPQKHNFWRVTRAELYDINGDFRKELLFTLHPGRTFKSRGLYVFDLKKETIINRFENQSSKHNFILYDLTGDGSREIIVLGKANGNGPKDASFTDYKNWIFILDHNLKLKFPPLSYGAYPSKFKALPVQIQDRPYLLIAHYRVGSEFVKKPLGIYLVDSRGRFERRHYFTVKNMAGVAVAADNADNPRQLFMTFNNLQLARYDIAANTLLVKDVGIGNLSNMLVCDMDLDGRNELLVESDHGIQIFDLGFNLLAKAEAPGPVHLSLRRRGQNLAPEIGVSGEERFYNFRVVSNPFFNWLPVFFIILFVFLIVVLFYTNSLINRLYIYFSYFLYSIKQTSNAVLLLFPGGRIFYFNSRLQNLLKIEATFPKNSSFREAFAQYPEISHFIAETLQSKESNQKELLIRSASREIHGQISARFFKNKFDRIIAWLIEIQDFSGPVLSDRQKIWSRTVRKMAHDIKTPLGTVLLNIERIQQKMQDAHPEALANTKTDFEMTISEIKRIHEMTRNFLKFSNLETPNLQHIQLSQLLQNVLLYFRPYLNKHLKIELNLEKENHILLADAKQLEMAFQIFIENSIDALKGKGKILITSVLAQNLEHHFKDILEIEIADNGPGIAQKVKDQIFEPFFSTKKDGTGMGLAIAKKIIEDHGGQVEVISRQNYGAVFRITLPAKRGEA